MNSINKICVILSLMLILTACNKRIFDYRNKYTGKYGFEYTESLWNSGSSGGTGGVYETNLYKYSGKIDYDKENDEIIKIHYRANAICEVKVTKNGDLFLPCGSKVGKFSSKKQVTVNIGSGTCAYTSLGSGFKGTIKGRKK